MPRKWKLFSVLGFEISIDISWFLILALVVWSLGGSYFPYAYPDLTTSTHWIMGLIAALLLFASVLIHELSHSVVARNHGLDISGIRLFIFGGISEMTEEPDEASAEFKIAVVGPITSLVLAGIFYVITLLPVKAWSTPAYAILMYLAILNLALGIFNLIPGFPLDGGRVLRAILWGKYDNLQRATDIAAKVGKGFAYLLIAFGAVNALSGNFISGIWYIFIGMFLSSAAEGSKRQIMMREGLSGVKIKNVMSTDVVTVPPEMDCQTVVDEYIMKFRFDMFPVVNDEGVLVGLITLHDVKHLPQDDWASTPIREVMDPVEDEMVLHPEDEAVDCLSRMVQSEEQGRMPVIDDQNDLVGIVTRRDIMNLLRIKTDLGT